MELNVWTSSTVTSAEKDASGTWAVSLTRILPNGTETKRVLHPTHVVFALGLGAGSWSIPQTPKQVLSSSLLLRAGLIHCHVQEEFGGEVIHAFQYMTAKKYVGRKVIVVGAGTSGHDIAFDLANHGVG